MMDAVPVPRSLRLAALAVAAIVVAGCTDWLTDPVEYGAIEVEVTRFSGEPVPGAELLLYRWPNTVDVGETDRAGFHRFEFVRPEESYGVWAEPPDGYIRPEIIKGGPSTAFVDRIGIEEGDVRGVAFHYLKVGPGTIDVSLAQPNGSPVEGVRLELYNPQGVLEGGVSDPHGRLTFDPVPFGNVAVRAFPPAIYLDEGEATVVFRHGIIIEEGTREWVSFTLERCSGSIVALVLDSTEEPVADAELELFSSSGPLETGRTDTDGALTFSDLRCGRHHGVRVFPPTGYWVRAGRGSSYFDALVPHRGDELSVTFHVLEPCRGSIRVDVVDDQGLPVGDVELELFGSTGPMASARTNADGVHTFSDLECGIHHGVRVLPTPPYSVTQGRFSSYFDAIVLARGEERVVTFTLQGG